MHYLHLILLVSTLPENKAFRGLLLPRRLSAIRVTVINILLAGYGNVIFFQLLLLEISSNKFCVVYPIRLNLYPFYSFTQKPY